MIGVCGGDAVDSHFSLLITLRGSVLDGAVCFGRAGIDKLAKMQDGMCMCR